MTATALAAALALLPAETDLVCVAYDDQLTDDQIEEALAGETGPGWERFCSWHDEAQEEGALYEIRQLPDDVRGNLSMDEEQELIDALRERDRSTAWDDLARRSRDRLFAYQVGDRDANADEVDVERCWSPSEHDEVTQAQTAKLRQVLALRGIDVTLPANAAAIDSLVAENLYHGGVVAVLWYGSVAPWLDLVGGEPYDDPEVGVLERPETTVTFTAPYVLVWNGWGGAGHFERFEGELTVPWEPERLHLCGPGQWDVDSCFGLVLGAFAATPTITKPEEA